MGAYYRGMCMGAYNKTKEKRDGEIKGSWHLLGIYQCYNWRAGVSQPSCTSGTVFLFIYMYIIDTVALVLYRSASARERELYNVSFTKSEDRLSRRQQYKRDHRARESVEANSLLIIYSLLNSLICYDYISN